MGSFPFINIIDIVKFLAPGGNIETVSTGNSFTVEEVKGLGLGVVWGMEGRNEPKGDWRKDSVELVDGTKK